MTCDRCLKPDDLCVCAALKPAPVRTSVLVLQHPQEPDVDLGTGHLLHLSLPGSRLRIGLSWPNLAAAWGAAVEARRWAVLYLGSAELPPPGAPALGFVDRKGKLRAESPAPGEIQGLVVLDGTWSQAKSLWWRNAWLLKLQRAVLRPPQASLYGRLRREPRRESVSTLEAAALALAALEGDEALPERLVAPFRALLEAYRRRRGRGVRAEVRNEDA